MSPPACFRVGIISFFPALFPGPLGVSVLGRALEKKRWSLDVWDLRDFGMSGGREVDGPPAGGGPGMVLRADVAAAAIDAARAKGFCGKLVYPSATGRAFSQRQARAWGKEKDLLFLCGRFEGVDQRVLEARGAEEWSLGSFVLAGGDSAALAMLEAVLRLLPGVVGNACSLEEESFALDGEHRVEYPHYTKPKQWEGRAIPPVLLSGNHGLVAAWRREAARARSSAKGETCDKKNQSYDKANQ